MLLCLSLLLNNSSFAQKEANIWYFGRNAGLDFSSGGPIAITNGQLNTLEGCATISNKDGVLLFYTDGVTVYNARHEVMQNGSGLMGHSSSTQSSIIVPRPSDSSLYYIFTTDATPNNLENGLRYSTVNIKLAGGKAGVSAKNILLHSPSTEKIMAVKHSNNKDIWVISHKYGGDEFLVYLIDKSGINTTPIVSKIGSLYSDDNYYGSMGYLKASPRGDKLAAAIRYKNNSILEIYDFDNKTGKVSNPITSSEFVRNIYGVEFSPNGSKLYATVGVAIPLRSVFQYDLEENDVFNSKTVVYNTTVNSLGAIQVAVDGKLYIASSSRDYLDVINKPNSKGHSCDYKESQAFLGGKKSAFGLPTFIQSYFKEELKCDFTYKGICLNDKIAFYATTNYNLATFHWDFGDNNSFADTAYGDTVNYTYPDNNVFNVKLIVKLGGDECEVNKSISVLDSPDIILPRDTFVCEGQNLTLTPLSYAGKVTWNTAANDTFPTITIDTAGIFIATNTNNCGIDKDTIKVTYKFLPKISIQTDTIVCPNQPFNASLTTDHKVVEWHDNKFIYNRTFTIQDTSILWIKSTNICGTSYDSVTVKTYPKLQFKINADSAVCPNVDFNLSASSNSDSSINWFNTTIGKNTTANIPNGQWIWAVTKNQCVIQYDSTFIATYAPTTVNLGGDKEICDTDILLDAGIMDAEYTWQNIPSFNTQTFTATKPGVYKVAATRCKKTVTDSITIYPPQDTGVYIPNAFTPNGDMLNDTFSVFIDGFAPKKYQLNIYSRWGEEVFKSNNYQQSWDGIYRTQPVPEGIYMYMLNLLHCRRIKRYKGNITLLR